MNCKLIQKIMFAPYGKHFLTLSESCSSVSDKNEHSFSANHWTN